VASEAVGMNVDSITCEIYGIIKALQLAVQYYSSCATRKAHERLYILSDCCSAVDIIVFRYKYRRYGSLLQQIQFIANQLLDMNISVHLAWIPGHVGVGDNEKADKLAKMMSEDLYKGRVSASSSISIASAFHLSNEIAFNLWQRKWEQDTTGHYTRQFMPKVGTKLFFPEIRNIGISYSRLLLNDTMLKDDSYRTGTSESPLCDCGLERESAVQQIPSCQRCHVSNC